MKKITALLLMMCLSCQLVLKLSIIAWFEINQDYIAATLCENKDKPELVCCGKCVLTKELKKADKNENHDKNNAPSKADKSASVTFILPETLKDKIDFSPDFIAVQNAILPHHFETLFSSDIFHPPGNFYS